MSKFLDNSYNLLEKKFFRNMYLFLMYVVLYAPIVILMLASFNPNRRMTHLGEFSMKWYYELFKDEIILKSLYNTLIIAGVSAIISTILGTFAAYGIHHYRKKWLQKTVLSLNNLPVLNPDIVTGVSLMVWFAFFFKGIFGMDNGMTTMIVAHITFCTPYVVISVLPRLRQMPKDTVEAALDLGATPFQAFYKVVIPEISSGIISGLMLAFTMSIDDFVISFFTSGSGVQNLSITVFAMTKKGISPKINALSTLMFITVFVLMLLVNKHSKIEEI